MWRLTDAGHRAARFALLLPLLMLAIAAPAGATTDSSVTTLTDNAGIDSAFNLPGHNSFSQGGIATSPDGSRVYVVEKSDNRVDVFTPGGALLQTWKSSRLSGPTDVGTDGFGNVYVISQDNGTVAVFTPSGKLSEHWSVPGGFSIAVNPQGPLYVLTPDSRVRVYNLEGKFLRKFQANLPGVWFPYNGYSETPDSVATTISVDGSGDPVLAGNSFQFLTIAANDLCAPGSFGGAGYPYPNPLESGEVGRFTNLGAAVGEGWLNESVEACYPGWESDGADPRGIAVDPNTGNVYVADSSEYRIDSLLPGLYNPDSGQLGSITSGPVSTAALKIPCFICVNSQAPTPPGGQPTGVAFDCRSDLFMLNGSGYVVEYDNLTAPSAPPCVPVSLQPPRISGVAQQGVKLTELHGSWLKQPTSYSYQWKRCRSDGTQCKSISGATGQSYTPVAGDVGMTLRVYESVHNASGSAGPVASRPSAVVVPPAPLPLTLPLISGSTVNGQTLTATPGTWTGSPTSFQYTWQDCDASGNNCVRGTVDVASGPDTEELNTGDVGHTIRVQVVAINAFGMSAPVTSGATPVVIPLVPVVKAPPSMEGDLAVGQTLTELPATWANNPTSISYQWEDCDPTTAACTAIPFASGPTYTLQASDVGEGIEVLEQASNAGGMASPVSSPLTLPVITGHSDATPAPQISIAPQITGPAAEGSTLTASTGTWVSKPVTYTYQWMHCKGTSCSEIGGATSASYIVSGTDQGYTIEVTVTAANARTSTSASSAATALIPVQPKPPMLGGKPV